ncbi:MAG: sigma-70 family RNA polymerase sigma factor [Candidatus Dormibacteraeota bacterium]|nr:sigma-70 family RNA polymerase sigma factor [Candidatus Dormibacteraeota bacterium]
MLNSALAAVSTPAAVAVSGPTVGLAATDSMGALYDGYSDLAFTLAFRIVRDRGVAEDVVQEAFLAVWRNADRFDVSRGSIQTWLCRIVRNRALDRLRGPSGRRRHDTPVDTLTSLASSDDVVSDVLRREEVGAITAALANLSPPQREAIELAYYGGYSQSQIAARTAVPLGTVKGRTRAAMRALAAALAPLRTADPGRPGRGRLGSTDPRVLRPSPVRRRRDSHSLQSDANAAGADH